MVMTMKKIKQVISFLFALMALMAYLFNEPEQTATVWQQDKGIRLETVLLDDEKECVPFTFYSSAVSWEEKVQEIINSMKVNQTKAENFYGFLPVNTEVQSVKVNQSVLEIDFNEAFYEIDPTLEIKAMEAMRYLVNQFDEIKKLHLTVNQKDFQGFGTYSVSMPIEKGNELNDFEMLDAKLHKTDSFSVAVIKNKNGNSYFTLKTIRSAAPLEESLRRYYCDESSILLKDTASLTAFDLQCKEDTIILNLGSEILNEDYQCDEQLVKAILLTLKSNFSLDRAEIWIEGVLMQEVDLKTISFNEI